MSYMEQDEKLVAFLAQPSPDHELFAQLLCEMTSSADIDTGRAIGELILRYQRPAIATFLAAAQSIEQSLAPEILYGITQILLPTTAHPVCVALYIRSCERVGGLDDPIVAENYISALRNVPERWRSVTLSFARYFNHIDEVVERVVDILYAWGDVAQVAEFILLKTNSVEGFQKSFTDFFEKSGLTSYTVQGNAAELYNRLILPTLSPSGPVSAELMLNFTAALRSPTSSRIRHTFQSIEREGAYGLLELWDVAMRDKYVALLEEASQEFHLEQANQRLNFVLDMSNIGDTCACLSFMQPIALARKQHINIIIPDTRTNAELVQFFQSDVLTFYMADRNRVLALPPWIQVAPQAPGILHGFSMGGELRQIASRSKIKPNSDRLSVMQAAFGLSDEYPRVQPTIWRSMGDVTTKCAIDRNKTVIVAPISVSLRNRLKQRTALTLDDLDAMWAALLDALVMAGWTPVLNGRNHNRGIQKFPDRIVQADLTLAELLQAVDQSRAFIGERSGLHDLIAVAGAGRADSIFAFHPEGLLFVPNIDGSLWKDVTINLRSADLAKTLRDWVDATLGTVSRSPEMTEGGTAGLTPNGA